MKLPDFLCIGAMRAGTTWLDSMLRSHPDIYLPEKRKEVHFFDQHYEHGIKWYESFFSNAHHHGTTRKIGEMTPAYLYGSSIPERIKKTLPDCRFIVIFRNPADRAYSHYGFLVKNYAEQRNFEDLLSEESELFFKGLYGKHIEKYLQIFSSERFLFLIYEDLISNPEKGLIQIANFLELDVDSHFDLSLTTQRKNASGQTRFVKARATASKFRDFLRNNNMDWLWNTARVLKLQKIFEGQSQPLPILDESIRSRLISSYESDISKLERLISMDLSMWRRSNLLK